MKKSLVILAVLTSFLAWNCKRTETANFDLKQSVNNGVNAVNQAVGTISSTKGYEVLNANSLAMKSLVTYTDSITLDSVAGIYDFQPDLFHYYDFFIPHRLFVKTGTSNMMIVNLPEKLVVHPRFLYELNAPDTLLKNNFTIKASDYYYYFNYLNKFDYRLKAGFTLDSADIGDLDVSVSAALQNGLTYASKYNFPGGYSLDVSFQPGDTTVNTFSLTKDNNILMKETVKATQPAAGAGDEEEFHHRERLYILTLGNVEIRRGAGLDSIQVYLDGVLQKHAGAKIVDSTGTDGSFCHKRDILLTFDDGTTEKLSTLLDPARQALKTLVDALHSMNFAKNIVDYIAIGIDYHFHHHHH
jgi:hypothetical protein